MNFSPLLEIDYLKTQFDDYIQHPNSPYGKEMTSIPYLNNRYGEYDSLDECIEKTTSKSNRMLFEYIKEHNLLN